MPSFARTDGRIDIKSLTLAEIEGALEGMGSERFRARQIYKWLWQKNAPDFESMSNLAKTVRTRLGQQFYIAELAPISASRSRDGTVKYLWRTEDGYSIESVLIPDDGTGANRDDRPPEVGERLTLCVSTQVGCAMACTFCLTGDLGLKRHLRPSEIANQPLQVRALLPEGVRISNVVMMGMGEPLHNYDNLLAALHVYLDEDALGFSHRKITVSTVGLVPAMRKLADALPVNLAVSLNASTEAQRLAVMPISRRHSMEELLQACRELPVPHHKRITFEYVMMAGFNDSLDDAARLGKLLRGIRSKVNLIPYNENPDRDIRRPPEEQVRAFQHYLVTRGVQCSVRSTRGIDVSAACGQLGKGEMSRMAAVSSLVG